MASCSRGDGSCGTSMSSALTFSSKQADLLDQIALREVECLNEAPAHPWANALKKGYRDDAQLVCESDADEQLLLNIPFSQVVKLHSIAVAGSPDDSGAFAPKTIHLYVNRPSMGFSDCESTKPTQTIELASADETTVDLAYVKFQNVHTLSVFIADNQGDEEVTKLSKLSIFGTLVQTTNMSEFKRVG
ncbi:PITH domain-containing protein [Pseudoscourfieldia marina]